MLQRRDRVGPRYIVVGNRSLGGSALTAELTRLATSEEDVRIHVVVPLAAGADLTTARQRLEMQLGVIDELGIAATGEIGDADPLVAIDAALAREPAVGIILSTFPPGSSRWQRSGVPSGVARRVNVPCVVVHNQDDGSD